MNKDQIEIKTSLLNDIIIKTSSPTKRMQIFTIVGIAIANRLLNTGEITCSTDRIEKEHIIASEINKVKEWVFIDGIIVSNKINDYINKIYEHKIADSLEDMIYHFHVDDDIDIRLISSTIWHLTKPNAIEVG